MKNIFIAILAAGAFVWEAAPICAIENADVEGDAAVLDLLHAAQVTNRTLYPSGELTADVTSRWDGAEVKLTASVVWADAATYWNYELLREWPERKSRERCEMIDDGKLLAAYFPDAHLLQKIADHVASRAEQLSLRPDQIWYRIEGIAEWAELLDREKPKSRRSGGAVRMLVTFLDEDRVQVERRLPSGESLRIVASLAANGNVIEYEGLPGKQSAIWRKGQYEWLKDSQGRCYLKELQIRARHPRRQRPSRPDVSTGGELFPPRRAHRARSVSNLLAERTV